MQAFGEAESGTEFCAIRMIAREHYLQVTDEHFEQAAQEAAQNSTQQPLAANCDELQADGQIGDNDAEMQLVAADSTCPQGEPVGGTGLEPVTLCV